MSWHGVADSIRSTLFLRSQRLALKNATSPSPSPVLQDPHLQSRLQSFSDEKNMFDDFDASRSGRDEDDSDNDDCKFEPHFL